MEPILTLFSQNMDYAINHENQRANATNYILVICSVFIGLITFDSKIECGTDSYLAILIIILGIYGVLLMLKHHERFMLHYKRAQKYKKKLSEIFHDFDIFEFEKESDISIANRYGVIYRLRLNRLWLGFHIITIVIGIILFSISIF